MVVAFLEVAMHTHRLWIVPLCLAVVFSACASPEDLEASTAGARTGAHGKCEPGQTKCKGKCLDTATDPLNCGACGNACSTGESCVSGACRATIGCGGLSQACCEVPPNSCSSGLGCLDSACQPLAVCGGEGQFCCSGNACQRGLVCGDGECVQPQACGGLNEPCCAGDVCDKRLTCFANACVPP